MIKLRDRPRLITDLIVAELLAKPGTRGPLARPVWGRPAAPPASPAARAAAGDPLQPTAAVAPEKTER